MNNKLPKKLKRKDVITFISDSASYGNLGSFIGAGFSKAILNEVDNIALSWGELLENVSGSIGIKYKDIYKDGVGYPEIASKICELYCQKENKSYEQGLKKIKKEIAKQTCWYPDKGQRKKFSPYLKKLNLSWVITTNYDLIIESLLTGKSISLGPNDSLTAPKDITPVFHLHGVRTKPKEIVITQEDYVSLFRPTEYRQIKLALMIKESTMLILGYGLGDVNVLTALDWSRNVFKGEVGNYPNEVIQVIRKSKPEKKPYRDHNSTIILEVSSLEYFFKEYSTIRRKKKKEERKNEKLFKKIANQLGSPEATLVDKFIDDEKFRKDFLESLGATSNKLITGFISFLNRCIDETWNRSEPTGAFQGYADNLTIILDIFTSFPVHKTPPALFETTAYALERVGYYIGDSYGKSFAAKAVWDNRKKELPKELVKELKSFAKQHDHTYIRALCKSIKA